MTLFVIKAQVADLQFYDRDHANLGPFSRLLARDRSAAF